MSMSTGFHLDDGTTVSYDHEGWIDLRDGEGAELTIFVPTHDKESGINALTALHTAVGRAMEHLKENS